MSPELRLTSHQRGRMYTGLDTERGDCRGGVQAPVCRGRRPRAAFGAGEDPARHPQPLRSYSEPFGLRAPLGHGLPVSYVYCTDPPYPAIASAHAIVRREGWEWRELATGHDAMIIAPELTAAELLR